MTPVLDLGDPGDPDYAIRRVARPHVARPQAADTSDPAMDDGGHDGMHDPEADEAEAASGTDPADPVGWEINFTRRARTVQMAFWDVTYGGRIEALFVARQTRDAMLSVLPPLTKRERRQIVRRTREPGSMPGVHYVSGTQTRASYWVATINLPAGPRGKRRNKVRWFNVNRLGYDEARRRAEAERTRMLDELPDGNEPALLNPTARSLHEQLSETRRS